jgi:hypothetical protein
MGIIHMVITGMILISDMTQVGAIGINTTVLSTKTIGVEILQAALGALEVHGAATTAAVLVPATVITMAIPTPAEEVIIPHFPPLPHLHAAAQAQDGAVALLLQEALEPTTDLLALEAQAALAVLAAQATPVLAHLVQAAPRVDHNLVLAQEEDNFPSTDS